MEVYKMELFERKNMSEYSDGLRIEPIEKEDYIYGDHGMPRVYDLPQWIWKRRDSIDRLEEHDNQRLEYENLMCELKVVLSKLYEEYKVENEAQRKYFSRRLKSEASDDKCYIPDDPLKIETWYFLTKEEARLHIQFDRYLESCSFIQSGSSPATVIENLRLDEKSKLQIFESLPEDLIVSGVQRKINQFNMLEDHWIFVKFVKDLVEHDYRKWGSSILQLLSRLRREKEFPYLDKLDDNMLMDGLTSYMILCDSSKPDVRKSMKQAHLQKISEYCERRRKRIMESWEIKETDGLIYYSAFKELQMESEKHATENLERMESIESSALTRNATNETWGELSKQSEWSLDGTIIPDWIENMRSEMEIIECEIERIISCIEQANLLRMGNKATQMDDFEVSDIDEANVREREHDCLKAEALQQLEFNEYLDSFIFERDECPLAIYKALDLQKFTLVPIDLALYCIEGRINRLKILDQHDQYVQFLEELVDYVPHIKVDDDMQVAYERLRTDNRLPPLPCYKIKIGLRFFLRLLLQLENPYDPDIRKGHRDDLLWIINKTCKIERRKLIKSWEPTEDIDCSAEVIKEIIAKRHSSEAYKSAKQTVLLHKKFDLHLASCEFVMFDSSRAELLKDERLILKEFSVLPRNLIEESIDVRIRILNKMHEFDRFAEFLRHLVQHDYMKFGSFVSNPQELLKISKWENFSDLPRHYIIRGILIYIQIHSSSQDPWRLLHSYCRMMRPSVLETWERTRYYDHPIYELVAYEEPEDM